MKSNTRSWSGVLVISIALDGKQLSCKYDCSYCPNETIKNGAKKDMARSYLSTEGTFLRGELAGFDIYKQTIRRLLELETMGHYPDKLEIIFLGGTWDSYDEGYCEYVVHELLYACNVYPKYSKYFGNDPLTGEWLSLEPFKKKLELWDCFREKSREKYSFEDEKKMNEKNECARVIGIVLETRPDQTSNLQLQKKRRLGCTRIQYGIQHTDNNILKKNKRHHNAEASVHAIRRTKNYGFKVDGHIMPDLPGSTIEKDYEMAKKIFLSDDYQLDYVKIYPCLDLPFTEIRKWKEKGEWKSYAETDYDRFIQLLGFILTIVPPWTRINRVHRDFPKADEKNMGLGYESETIKTNLNQLVHQYLEKNGMRCYDIRNREIKNMKWEDKGEMFQKSRLYIRQYEQFDGREYFISVEIPKSDIFDDTILLGFIRMRIIYNDLKEGISIIRKKKTARIRELHVYGYISNTENKNVIQHSGIGKCLLQIAETIAYDQHDCENMLIISGIGVRDYYRKYGYYLTKEGEYMMKKLKKRYIIFFHNKIYISFLLSFGSKTRDYHIGKGFMIYSIMELLWVLCLGLVNHG